MAHSVPKATFTADSHRYIFTEENAEFILERFADARDGIQCELIVNGQGGQLRPRTRINLLADRTISSLAKELAERTPAELKLDWRAMLTVVASTSVDKYRAGDAPIDLTSVSGWRQKPRYLLHPFIESSGDTVMFADGGTGKSTVALLCGVSVATGLHLLPETRVWQQGNVLYLDWEADAETHAERLEAIRQAFDPPLDIKPGQLIYKRMYAPIDESIDDLRGIITKHQIVLVIVDSLGRARGGKPEDGAETIAAFAAIRRLLVPTLMIDHMSKEAIFGDRGSSRPIGSIYTHNNARLTWSLTAGGSEYLNEDGQDNGLKHAIRLTNHKNNNGRLQSPRTYTLQYFTDDQGRLEQIFVDGIDAERIPEFLRMLPLWKRARMWIEEHGPTSTKDLAEALGAKDREVVRNLAAQGQMFDLARADDGRELWQLIADAATVSGQPDMFNESIDMEGRGW